MMFGVHSSLIALRLRLCSHRKWLKLIPTRAWRW
jgi:hypothetical protein